MSDAIFSTIKFYEHSVAIIIHDLANVMRARIIKIVTALGEGYFTRHEGLLHVRYYVDPITGRPMLV